MFPVIKNINDVLPYIEAYPEIRVHEKPEGFTVIDYMISTSETFKDDDEFALSIRRECRGIAFDTATGTIVSRPFSKFHNVGENEYSQPNDISFDDEYIIEEKLDGSMCRSIRVGDSYRLGTRAGVTEFSILAEEFVKNNPAYHSLIQFCTECGMTCMFELLSGDPTHHVVLKHDETQLVLTGIRNNATGFNYDIHNTPCDGVKTVSKLSKSHDGINALLNHVKGLEGQEGVVIKFEDGRWFKVKSEWYIKLHHGKDLIRFEKDVIKMILDGTIDDIIPALDAKDATKVKNFQTALIITLNNEATFIKKIVTHAHKIELSSAEFHKVHSEHKSFGGFHNVAMNYFRQKEKDEDSILKGMIDGILRKCGSITTINEVRDSMLGGLNYNDY